MDNERENLLTILRRNRPAYSVVYFGQMLAWFALVAWNEAASGQHAGPVSYTIAVGTALAPLAFISLVVAIGAVDTGRHMMTLFWPDLEAKYRKDERAKQEAKRRAERRAENAAIMEWYARQQNALRRGEPFDEPPPLMDDDGDVNGRR